MDITYDLINTVQRTQDAIPFGVADWSLVAYLPGRVNFTGHTCTLNAHPMISANATFALLGLGSQARVRALHYAGSTPVWTTLGTVVHQGPNEVQLLRVDIKPTLEAVWQASVAAGASRGYCYITPEVLGTGSLYMARLEVEWKMGP